MQLIGIRCAQLSGHPTTWNTNTIIQPVYQGGADATHQIYFLKHGTVGTSRVFGMLHVRMQDYREDATGVLYHLRRPADHDTQDSVRIPFTHPHFAAYNGQAHNTPAPGQVPTAWYEYLVPLDHPLFAKLVTEVQRAKWTFNPAP